MRISDVRVHVVVPDPEPPARPGYRASWIFVEISTDDGLTGVGECSNWPHDSDLMLAHALRYIGRTLIGRDPGRIEQIWREIFGKYTYLGSRGLITGAISGIDMALWDLKGKALGAPVYELLGGAVRDRVRLYTHPRGGSPEALAAHAAQLTNDGWAAFKWDPFGEMGPRHTNYQDGYISKAGVRAAADMVQAVRDSAGPDAEIMIDLHGHYNVESALRCIEALRPFDITWFEEPFPPEGTRALRQLRAQTDAPLCVGERLHTRSDFLPVLTEGLANFVMPDVCWTGGISELKKIAIMAEPFFVPIAPHGALGPVQVLAGAHTMMTVPNFYRLEILEPAVIDMYNECLLEPLKIDAGELTVPDSPGLGLALNPDYLAEHTLADRE